MGEDFSLSDNLNLTVYHSLYLFYPTQLQALNDLKKENKYGSNAIDLMYIPVFTAFIESLLSEVITQYLDQKEATINDDLSLQLIEKLRQEMIRGTWEKSYKANFEIIFGITMKQVVSDEVLKAIDALYIFRNQSGHGRQVIHEFNNYGDIDNEAATLAGNYKRLHYYFLEKKLITKEELLAVTFVNDKIIAHFIENVKRFAENLVQKAGLKMYTTLKEHVLTRL